jgi:bacterioferritin
MRGKVKVIAHLNEALKAELTSISQYFLHAEMCENWGYHRLGELIKRQSIDEMKHAEELIERILFLEGTPNLGMGLSLKVGSTVKMQLEADLGLEVEAVAQYNAAMKTCVEEGDNTSRELFQKLLKDEEEHVDFLESQIHLIEEVGLGNYLARQMLEKE